MIRRADIMVGDSRNRLRELSPGSVQCVVTSPPYWGLRDYGIEAQVWGGSPDCAHEWGEHERYAGGAQPGEKVKWQHVGGGPSGHPKVKSAFCRCGAWRGDLGLEPTPALYVEHMVSVFREVRRVLRKDGTLWLNLGDCYATSAGAVGRCPDGGEQGERFLRGGMINTQPNRMPIPGLKPKDLVGIPWRVAFALQSDGWWLRSDIVWSKPNPMPESVTDRPTKAHEYLFLLTKSERYFYDADAIREPNSESEQNVARAEAGLISRASPKDLTLRELGGNGFNPASEWPYGLGGRNRRTVWTIATQPFPGAHFAVMPEALVEPCVLAGSRHGDLILDPFAGAGTVGVVALKHGRAFVGVELNPKYAAMARNRICDDAPLFNVASVNDGEAA